MDTRSKILTLAGAFALKRQSQLTAYLAYFDPLQSVHARRLAGLAEPQTTLLAVVLEPPNPLLPLQARAELAAALAIIDFVLPLEGDPAPFLLQLAPMRIVEDQEEDLLRTAQLIAHVRNRYE